MMSIVKTSSEAGAPWEPALAVATYLHQGHVALLLFPPCWSTCCRLPSTPALWACVNLAFCSAVGVKKL